MNRGFTLLECLVALAIVAVALTSGLHALGAIAFKAENLREHTLASWVAQNRLAMLRAEQSWPALGVTEGQSEQAGQLYPWRAEAFPTPNPLFRRVDITVLDPTGTTPLASMTGFVARPLR